MTKLERLTHWKSIATDAVCAAGRKDVASLDSVEWKSEDDLFDFFNFFRPDGAGLEKVFSGVVGGDEILSRLLIVYQATKESFNRDMYFIVRRPVPATHERLVDLTRQHYEKVRQIADSFGSDEIPGLIKAQPDITIRHGPPPDRKQPDYSAPETSIYDVVGDWFRSLNPVPSDALWMGEAFYSIACDYYLARYLMWPLYRRSTTIDEPFASSFELWRHGALAIFSESQRIVVYVSADSTAPQQPARALNWPSMLLQWVKKIAFRLRGS